MSNTKKWRLIAGKYQADEHLDNGTIVNYKRASWIIESDSKPVFQLVPAPGSDVADSICIEQLGYDYELEQMQDPYSTSATDNAFVDSTYIRNFIVKEVA